MSSKEFLGIISMALILVSAIPYIHSVLKRETTPTKSSWIIWALIGFCFLVTYRDSGAKETMWAAIAGFINPCIIAVISLKYGRVEWTKLDTMCLIGACISLTIWKVFSMPVVALMAAIITDGFGALPTIRNVWKEPHSEKPLAWLLFSVASGINLFAINKWEFAIALYPLYMTIASLTIVWPLVKYHWLGQRKTASL